MDRARILKLYLYVFGILNLLTAFSVPLFFGDVLLWSPRNIPTELMIGGLYFAVGIVMILVARNPLSHKAFVDFVVISNILHAIVMLVYVTNVLQVVLDVGFVGSMGVLPLLFYPWGLKKFLQY